MSTANISIKGMNLYPNISDSGYGDCEELINVRSENGNLKIDTDYEVVSADIPYRDIIRHDVGINTMYIGKDSSGVVWFNIHSGSIIKRLYSSTHDNIYVATSGNLLTISDCQSVKTIVYRWQEDQTYTMLYDGDINLSVSVECLQGSVSDMPISALPEDLSEIDHRELVSTINAALNQFEQENKNAAEGGFLLAWTLTMYDNNEVGPFGFQYIPVQPSEGAFTSKNFIFYDDGWKIKTSDYYKNIHINIKSDANMLSSYKDLIKNVNVYVSRPISRLDISTGSVYQPYHLPLEKTDLPKQLLFLNKSWNLEEFITYTANDSIIGHDVVFGGDSVTTERTMPVTTAHLSRAGKLLTYNARTHYYDSYVRLDIPELQTLAVDNEQPKVDVEVYVHIRVEGKDIVQVYDMQCTIEERNTHTYYLYLPELIMVTDTRAYKISIIYNNQFFTVIPLSPSPTYDYAYAYGDKSAGVMNDSSIVQYEIPIPTDNIYREYDIINVSSQNNPIFFPPQNSYRTQGRVLDIQVAVDSVSAVKIGTYPLYIFTDRCIALLNQGSGEVLYAGFDVISTDVVTETVSTRTAVAYIANSSIYLLSGRQTINLSLPIEGEIDTRIRQAPAYSECCINDTLYNVGSLISRITLREYLEQAILSYSPAREELIVSNPNYLYSYSLSLTNKQWRKISGTYHPLSGNLLSRDIRQNSSAAAPAKGKITIADAIIIPSHTFTATASASYKGSYTSRAGERFAIVIGDTQVSSSLFFHPSSLATIISTLTQGVEYLDDYYSEGTLNIYYGAKFEPGTLLRLVNLTTGSDVLSLTLAANATTVTIPDKGLGSKITLNNIDVHTITADDTVLTLASILEDVVNENTATLKFSAYVNNNVIDITADQTGPAGNSLKINLQYDDYITISVQQPSGGKDVTMEPGDYVQIVDLSKTIHTDQVIHIQTRPFSLDDSYTVISRAILYCRAILASSDNLSMYIFASNNMYDWQCVAASQKSGISIDHIRTLRVARSYKYYTIIIGGKIYSNSELGNIMIDIRTKYSNKLR